ncbi:short chain oxidoreductase [Aspergillus cavernicola]|uniref:Short chain oxidoreductase n=1 Tax=Aspergillus cavernicola TaxID=176166 RepID=A0ABR4IRB5_9EURO
MFSYLITGAGRGLGLELTKQLRQRPPSEVSAIFATIRGTPSETLQELVVEAQGRIVIVHLVVTEKEGIAAAVDQVKEKLDGRGLDVLINNAVITETSPDGAVSMGALRETLQVNVEAGHEVTVAFLALLREGREKKVLNLSSSVGSIALARLYAVAPHPAYKISKAALNNLTAQYALELEKDGFTFVVVSPGWLKTDMGGEYAQLDVSVGASAVLDVIARDGKELRFRDSTQSKSSSTYLT